MPRCSYGRGERTRSFAWLLALVAVSMAYLAMTAGAAMAAPAANQAAPTLKADGLTLRWAQVADVNNYVLATKVSGQATTYRIVSGTSFTPPVVANASVDYGLRTDVAGSAWATEVAISFVTVSNKTAPTLGVDGQTLRWNQIATVKNYVLATKVPGAATTYRNVSGTSVTPAGIAGKTIAYGLRTDVTDSSWAVEASISTPATPGPVVTPTPVPPVVTPTPVPPVVTPPAPSGAIRFGIAANSDFASTDMMNKHQAMGSPPVRFDATPGDDFTSGSHDGLIDNFAKRGIKPLVVMSYGNSYPSTGNVEKFCRTYATRFGPGGTFWAGKSYAASVQPAYIEVGNESSFSYHSGTANGPETYARLFKTCGDAVKAANPRLKLLAQGEDPSGTNWINRMYSTVPNLNDYVGGWVTHPYGPESRADPMINRIRDQTAAKGSTAPLIVTEWGLSTDNGRSLSDNYAWPKNQTYTQARDALVSTMTRWKSKYPRLKEVYYFQTKDQRAPGTWFDREGYFGLLTNGGATKGVLYDTYANYVRNGL